MPSSQHIVVIGGGLSGLACAWRLQRLGLPVLLLEGSTRFGGVIGAVRKDGFHFDIGPQSIRISPSILALIEEAGLADKLCHAPPHAPRYILKHGRLEPAPLGPLRFLQTPLLSWKTRLRMLRDPFSHSQPPPDDESVADFVRRKFGADLLENLAAPLMSGIYAGDPEKLSLRSTFPRLREFEEASGSVVRGAIHTRRAQRQSREQKASREAPASEDGAAKARGSARPPRATLSNFPGGLVMLTDALAAGLGDAAHLSAEVLEIRPGGAAAGTGAKANFAVTWREDDAPHSVAAAAVVLATPTAPAAQLLAGIEPRFGETLARIEYVPMAQVSAGYPLKDLSPTGARRTGDALSGFGFLVPRSEGLRLLGTVWNSSLFAGRAPDGAASFTSFLGGATDPGIAALAEGEIARIARDELGLVMHASHPPLVEHVAVWPRALPQYNLGHPRIVATLKELCANHPGIFLAGNYLSGPSLPNCVDAANRIAEDVALRVKG